MTLEHAPGQFRLVEDGQVCVLDYTLGDGIVTFTHTGVPPALRGQGLAAQLVDAGLQWAEAQGLRVVPACSYVAVHMRRRGFS